MASLPELQSRVMAALLAGGEAADALVRPSPALTPARRLQVYRNNVHESLTAALKAVYPVVARLVGEAFFRQAARAYVRAHPSRSGNVQDFGGEWPGFLRALPAAAALPYLGDVAALEWAYHVAYHEAALPALDPAELAALPPAAHAGLRFALQPSARFVASPYPVLAIWQANQDDDGAAVSLDEGGDRLVVVQQALDVEFRRLSRGEDAWLRALAAGRGLGEATAAALADEPAFDLAAALRRHLAQGLFTAIATEAAE